MQTANHITPAIAVVHLVWLPYGISVFNNFIDSYSEFTAGVDHQLLLVFNGVKDPLQTAEYHHYAKARNIAYNSISIGEGQDLDCYFKAAKALRTEYIMILNSFATLKNHNWLKKYAAVFLDSGNAGLVGATASNQSYYSSVFQKNQAGWEADKSFMHNFQKYKLFVKAFVYWRFLFKPFPNPHIRTNGFMIRRSVFLALQHSPFKSKFMAYRFESGRKSMTNQVLAQGYTVLVIDINGKTFEPPLWKESLTFWAGNQENLLIADNQTDLYSNASPSEKKKMAWLAWGKA